MHSNELAVHQHAIETLGDEDDLILEPHHSGARRRKSYCMCETQTEMLVLG